MRSAVYPSVAILWAGTYPPVGQSTRFQGSWGGYPVRRRKEGHAEQATERKNEKQYEGLKKKGMSKERAAKIANSPGASKRGGKKGGKKSGSKES